MGSAETTPHSQLFSKSSTLTVAKDKVYVWTATVHNVFALNAGDSQASLHIPGLCKHSRGHMEGCAQGHLTGLCPKQCQVRTTDGS